MTTAHFKANFILFCNEDLNNCLLYLLFVITEQLNRPDSRLPSRPYNALISTRQTEPSQTIDYGLNAGRTAGPSVHSNSYMTAYTLPQTNRYHTRGNGTEQAVYRGMHQLTVGEHSSPPRHPEYQIYNVRLSSFMGWPDYLVQEPHMVADAGFYYTGKYTSEFQLRWFF